MSIVRHDRNFWIQKSNYLTSWARRAKAAAVAIPDKWVCDIGCGMEVLRSFLPRGTVYLPADLRQWNEGVELCDLDAGRMPERSLRLCDVCVMLGVIEHLEHPEQALKQIAKEAEFLVLSYNRSDQRLNEYSWKNALSPDELKTMVVRNGYTITTEIDFQRQIIVRAVNESFDEQRRERRAAARIGFRPRRPGWRSELRRAAHHLKALSSLGTDRSGRRREQMRKAGLLPPRSTRD
jgi:hypothetical protein